MQKKFLKTVWILFYIFVFLFLVKNSFNYLDPDLGWHLKIGEDILNEKKIPNINYYNYTTYGESWVDHEWLANSGMFWIYENHGYLSLVLFFSFLILASLIILNIFTQKVFLKNVNNQVKNAGIFFIILFQTIGLFAIAPHIGVRIQEISILNTLLLLIILYCYEEKKSIKILFFIPALFYFWACVHGGFLIGLFILFFWIGIKLFRDRKNIFNKNKYLLYFAFLSVFLTFLTPYGIKLYSFLSDYKNTYYLTHIQEWFPSYYFPIYYWQIFYSALIASAIFLLIFFFRKKQKINIFQVLISLFFLVLTFKSKRHFPLLFIVSFPLIITFFASQFSFPEKILNNFKNKLPKLIIFLKSLIIISFLFVIFITAKDLKIFSNPFNSFCYKYPCQAVEFLKNNNQYDDLNIFNDYGWGGYMLWIWPERKLFIDGRMPQYEFAGHTILEEYNEFFEKNKVEKKLNKYNIKLILLKKEKNNNKNYLENYLNKSDEWKIIFKDEVSTIYLISKFRL